MRWIRFELTEQDAVLGNTQLALAYPVIRRTQFRAVIGVFLYMMAVTLLLAWLVGRQGAMSVIGFGAIISIIVTWLVIFQYRRGTRNNMRGIIRDLPTEAYLTEHKVEILNDGVERSSKLHRTWLAWKAIHKLDETKQFYFIQGGPAHTFMIPKARILEGNLEQFWQELNEEWTKSRGTADRA